MLQASSERAAAARLWVPGMIPGPMDAVSARAQEIARRREEMLGMLHDLPESEYELSLTDLVEKAGGEEAAAPPAEGRDQPDAVLRRRPDPQRRLRVLQEGEGPGRRDRQVLVVAVGSAVAQVQPAGPGLAARRVRHARRVGRNPQSGKALRRFTCQSLSSGLVSAPSFFFLLQACSSVHMLCV